MYCSIVAILFMAVRAVSLASDVDCDIERVLVQCRVVLVYLSIRQLWLYVSIASASQC